MKKILILSLITLSGFAFAENKVDTEKQFGEWTVYKQTDTETQKTQLFTANRGRYADTDEHKPWLLVACDEKGSQQKNLRVTMNLSRDVPSEQKNITVLAAVDNKDKITTDWLYRDTSGQALMDSQSIDKLTGYLNKGQSFTATVTFNAQSYAAQFNLTGFDDAFQMVKQACK